jgi:hypothetical protein
MLATGSRHGYGVVRLRSLYLTGIGVKLGNELLLQTGVESVRQAYIAY